MYNDIDLNLNNEDISEDIIDMINLALRLCKYINEAIRYRILLKWWIDDFSNKDSVLKRFTLFSDTSMTAANTVYVLSVYKLYDRDSKDANINMLLRYFFDSKEAIRNESIKNYLNLSTCEIDSLKNEYKKLRLIIDRLRKHRNCIYAHNIESNIFRFENENEINYKNISDLLDFAIRITKLILNKLGFNVLNDYSDAGNQIKIIGDLIKQSIT